MFLKNTETSVKEICSSILGVEERSNPGKYLDFPLATDGRLGDKFSIVLDKIRNKLVG